MFDKQYYCLVAGLREYTLDTDAKGFDARAIIEEILPELTPRDTRLVRLLYGYYDSENLVNFHRGSSRFNPLGNLSQEEIAERAKAPETGEDASDEQPNEDETSFEQATWEAYYAECARSKSRFLREWSAFDRDLRMRAASVVADEPNLLEKERKLDRLRWSEVDELSTFDYFDIDAILAYLVKVNIVARWMRLDERQGREMLQRLLADLDTKEMINKQ